MALPKLVPKAVFISGCNRGIGLELVKQLLRIESPPKFVFATFREKDSSKELLQLADENQNLHPVQLDVTDFGSLPGTVRAVEDTLEGSGLNLLFNNVGVGNKRGLHQVTVDMMRYLYEVNTLAPFMFTRAFLPLLRRGAKESNMEGMSCSKAAVVNMSSTLASVENTNIGGVYAYRASKSALNMITHTLACEPEFKKGILSLVMHPGWVKTELGGPAAPTTTADSVQGILKVLEAATEKDTGLFFDYQGAKIPW